MTKARNYNFDILRIIAMLMIIIHHITVNDFGLQKYLVTNEILLSNKQTIILMFINSLAIIGVNIFFLISGYFKINLSKKKILNLVICIYLLFGIVTLSGIILGYVSLSKETLINVINPFGLYWFLLVYLIITILSPILNKIIENVKEKEAKQFFILVILVFSIYSNYNDASILIGGGYSLIWGCILYILGGFINKFKIKESKGLLYYFILVTINTLISYLLYKSNRFDLAWNQFKYNNIIIFLESICIFIWFNSIKKQITKSKIITFFASSTLITYLLHSTCWLTILRNYPIKTLINHNLFYLGVLFLPIYALIIYFVCSIVSLLYDKTIKVLINRIVKI